MTGVRGIDDPLDSTYFRLPFTTPKYRGVDFGCRYFPHCESLVGGVAYFDERCRVWSDEELAECQAADFGPALTRANQETALAAGEVGTDAYKRMFPDDASAFYQGVQLTGGNPATNESVWFLVGIGALAFGALLIARK